MFNANYQSHTTPLFFQAKILKVADIHEYLLAIYMYKSKLRGDLGQADHTYGTRHRGDAPVAYQRLTLTQHSIEYLAPRAWNTLPQAILMNLISRDSSN